MGLLYLWGTLFYVLFANHHIDDFFVGFLHADSAEAADVADGVFDAF